MWSQLKGKMGKMLRFLGGKGDSFKILLKYSWLTIFCLISAVQQSDSVMHICIIFSYSFPLWFITGYWIEFPVLYSRILLFIHPTYNSLHLLISNFQSFPPPSTFLLVRTRLFSTSVNLFLFHKYVHWCCGLDSAYEWYHMVFVFLTYLVW